MACVILQKCRMTYESTVIRIRSFDCIIYDDNVTLLRVLNACAQGYEFESQSCHGGVGQILLKTIASPHPGVKGVWQL